MVLPPLDLPCFVDSPERPAPSRTEKEEEWSRWGGARWEVGREEKEEGRKGSVCKINEKNN